MGAITIRKISDTLKQAVREAAAANGRSMEAELRALLEETYNDGHCGDSQLPQKPRKSFGQMLYEASRPGFEIPQAPDSPASHADFDPLQNSYHG